MYDGYEEKIVAEALCETKELVRQFYHTILSFAQEALKSKSFVEDWIMNAYNNECGKMEDDDPRIPNIFIKKVSSEIIESFLSNDQSTVRFTRVK